MRWTIYLCTFFVLAGCSRDDSVSSAGTTRTAAEFWSRYLPQSAPSESEWDALSECYRKISIAYTNGNVSVLKASVALISNRVENIDYHLYPSLVQVAKDLLYERFLLAENLKKPSEFPDPDALASYLEMNVEMVKLFGSTEAARLEPHNSVDWMEGMTLRRLTEYQQKYFDAGEKGFAVAAERVRKEWVENIESESGLTRMKMRHWLPVLVERAKEMRMPQSDAVSRVRSYARCVINCGYTPKWLDEEFPLPESDKNQH